MNYHTKIFTLLFLSLQSLITFSAQPSAAAGAAAAGAGADAQQKEMRKLRDENELWRQKIAAAIAALKNRGLRIIPASIPKDVQLDPLEQLHELLKAFRAAVDAKTNRSDKHNEEVIAFIREHRATINAMKSVHGETPLMLCAAYGSQFGVEVLVNEMKADIFAIDNNGRSVLYYCISPDYYPTALDYFALKMKNTHQHLIEDTLAYVRSSEVVDRLWPLLTSKSKTVFAFRCKLTHPAYANIKKELLQIKQQAQNQKSIAQMGAEVAHAFAQPSSCASTSLSELQRTGKATEDKAAMTPEQFAKLETKKAAQLRRKESKRKQAEEEKAQQALALQKKQEKEEQEAAAEEARKKAKERDTELRAKADAFEKAHEKARNAQTLKHSFEYWKTRYGARKQQELDNKKLADEHWQTLKNKHEKKHALTAVSTWKKLVTKQKALNKTADMFVAKKALLAWRAAHQQAHEELNLRLIACANAFDMYQHIKNKKKKYYSSKDNKELEETAMQLELGRAQINLLLSGQRIVKLYAQRGYTSESFKHSKKPHDTAAQKLLFEIEKHLGNEYSFGPNSPMIEQFFKNSLGRKETHEEEQAHTLFDAVRARDTKRITDLLKPSLRNSEHAHLNTFRHWLGTQSAELPANAMINGKGMRDILSMAYLEQKGKTFSLIGKSKVIESMPSL